MLVRCVSFVSSRPAASCAQIRAQIWLLRFAVPHETPFLLVTRTGGCSQAEIGGVVAEEYAEPSRAIFSDPATDDDAV